jgi:hypothetical protein
LHALAGEQLAYNFMQRSRFSPPSAASQHAHGAVRQRMHREWLPCSIRLHSEQRRGNYFPNWLHNGANIRHSGRNRG